MSTTGSLDEARAPARAVPHGLATTLLVAAAAFLSMADVAFATRIGGWNVRWAQGLLLIFTAAALRSPHRRRALLDAARGDGRLVVGGAAVLAFAGVASSLLSPSPVPGLVKSGWWLFNLGSTAVLCTTLEDRRAVIRGLAVGLGLVAAVVWVDTLAIYILGTEGPVLGGAQTSYLFEGRVPLRPHAFFYEPSYAGSAFALALCVLLALGVGGGWFEGGVLVLLSCAIVFTTSRTGLVGFAVVLLAMVGRLALLRGALLRRQAAVPAATLLVLLAFFLATPQSRSYGRFLLGPLGPRGVTARLATALPTPAKSPARPAPAPSTQAPPAPSTQAPSMSKAATAPKPSTSEGARLDSFLTALERWRQNPLLGSGTTWLKGANGSPLKPMSMATWAELLAETGLVGTAGFLLLVLGLLARAYRRCSADRRLFVVVAAVVHLGVNLTLTQTYPRLDYWLLLTGLAALSGDGARARALSAAPESRELASAA
jgi:hypothetical protein